MDWSRYDFVDFGCSTGGSLVHCRRRFKAGRGLGIDIDGAKLATARSRGLDVVEGDLNALSGSKVVRFVSMMQFLEHLPDMRTIERVLVKAADLATDFLYVHHPSFEEEHYLLSRGLRLYFHHWSGHTAHARVAQLLGMFERLGLLSYHVRFLQPIHDSSHPSVLPSAAEINQHEYDAARHGPKPEIAFPSPVYQHLEIFAALRAFDPAEWASIVMA